MRRVRGAAALRRRVPSPLAAGGPGPALVPVVLLRGEGWQSRGAFLCPAALPAHRYKLIIVYNGPHGGHRRTQRAAVMPMNGAPETAGGSEPGATGTRHRPGTSPGGCPAPVLAFPPPPAAAPPPGPSDSRAAGDVVALPLATSDFRTM